MARNLQTACEIACNRPDHEVVEHGPGVSRSGYMRWIALIAATLAAALFSVLYLPFRVWLSPVVYEAVDPALDSDDGGVDVDDFREAP